MPPRKIHHPIPLGATPRCWGINGSALLLLIAGALLGGAATSMIAGALAAESGTNKGTTRWVQGKGWGWVWGPDDEVGALNEMTNASRLRALSLVKKGQVYDLGVLYSRRSFKWPGHSPGEIMTFRSPEGIQRQKDVTPFVDPVVNPDRVAWHSGALFISDNVATQIDGLGHITVGPDHHWYNGFREADWGGNFGIRKCGAETIPPVIARAVLLDIAGLKGVDCLPSNYEISVGDIDAALAKEKVTIDPGDVILVRTGCLSQWGEDGADHGAIAAADSAGLGLTAIKYLVEEKGALLIASDTRGLECAQPQSGARSPIPGHQYLLVEQGVHIGEFHFLEELARDQVYECCYIAITNKIAGTAAGFCMRPIALR